MTTPARALDDEQPDAGLDWGTEEVAELLGRVRRLCGVMVRPDFELNVATALQEAREVLAREDEMAVEYEIEIEDDDKPCGSWSSPSWREAAVAYQTARGDHILEVETEPERLRRLRRLMEPGVTLERAWSDHPWRAEGRAAESIVEALMVRLRRGLEALEEPDTRRRLTELSDDQVLEVAARLQKLERKVARAWLPDEIERLIELRETFRR
jgi:hypothetical protein